MADLFVLGLIARAMIANPERVYAEDSPLIHAAGHEHNLQVLRNRGGVKYAVISGGGIYNHTTPTRAITGTLYTRRASGWTTVAFLRDGRVRLAVRTVDAEGQIREEFSMWLDVPPISRPAPPVDSVAPVPAADTASARAPAPAPAPPSPPSPPGARP